MKQPTLPGLEQRQRFERFKQFHRDNPRMFELFKRFAESALENGRRRRFGARMIWERIRWFTAIETSDEEYKVNDHFWPYYARLLMLTDDRFTDFFERRDNRFDVDDATMLDELT